jgi:hypothetical protein
MIYFMHKFSSKKTALRLIESQKYKIDISLQILPTNQLQLTSLLSCNLMNNFLMNDMLFYFH